MAKYQSETQELIYCPTFHIPTLPNIKHKMRILSYISLLLLLSLSSCNKLNPANFWDDFDSKNIVSSEGDFQGRYGYKIVDFKRNKGTYNISDILLYAKKNGWNLHDRKKYEIDKSVPQKKNRKLLFRARITGFEPIEMEGGFVKVFPRYINRNFTVYEFDTDGMILVNSHTGSDTTQRVGFVLLSADKTMMTAYHLWGETERH